MKIFVLSVWLSGVFCHWATAQDTKPDATTNQAPVPVKIAANEARNYIGTNAIVTGKVAEVNIAERLVRLNLEKPYPDQAMTAVIFAAKTNLFPEVEKLNGQTIEVSGKITLYPPNSQRAHPEIVINGTNQLRVLPKTEEREKK
jgi:DNA/RNA endonuclease YhcR with UshA esterase domain